jgi:hypothetical protein
MEKDHQPTEEELRKQDDEHFAKLAAEALLESVFGTPDEKALARCKLAFFKYLP